MFNPYLIIAGLFACRGLAISGFTFGVKYESGQHAKAAQLVADVREQAQLGAAAAIAKNWPINQTVRQTLEKEIRIVPDHSRCMHSDDGLRAVNAALEDRAVEPSGGVVPGADTAHR